MVILLKKVGERMFTVWHAKDRDLANWLINNSMLKSYLKKNKVKIEELFSNNSKNFVKLPTEIQSLLYLDMHDLIVTINREGADIPFLAIELMQHTPQGEHVKQRFCRLAASAEYHIPTVFILPQKKGTYKCTMDVFFGMSKLMDFHSIPVFGFFWPHKYGQLLSDKKNPSGPKISNDIIEFFKFVDSTIENAIAKRDPIRLFENPNVMTYLDTARKRAYDRSNEKKFKVEDAVRNPNLNLELIETKKVIQNLKKKSLTIEKELPIAFKSRKKSLIYSAHFKAQKSAEHMRTDPYAGHLSFFDYCYCRVGPLISQRRYNLIFEAKGVSFKNFKEVYHSYWEKKCPYGKSNDLDMDEILNVTLHLRNGCTYTRPKTLRTYGYLPDMLIFDDYVLFR